MSEIILSQGKVVLVDDQDFEYLSQFSWSLLKSKYTYYAFRREGGRKYRAIYMHRELMNPSDGLVVDHINGDGLDNRRNNLRVCSRAQSNANWHRPSSRNTSGYKGVIWAKNISKWVAQIGYQRDGARTNTVIGYFNNPLEASKAYEREAIKRYGNFVNLQGGSD